MAIEVDLPDGSVAEFPDGTSREMMKGALAKYQTKNKISWADVPGEAVANIPASAVKFAHDIVQPILHPIETGKGIFNVGYGLASKAAGAMGMQQDPTEKAADEATVNAIGGMMKDRYGSMDALKQTLAKDPVGAAADASLILSGGGAAAARVPGAIGQAGRAAAATGAALDPLNAVVKAGQGVGHLATNVLGVTTGSGAAPIRGLYDAGKAGNTIAREHMRDSARIDEVVGMAERGVSDLVQQRGKAYKAGMASTNSLPTPLDLKPIENALTRAGNDLHFKGIVKSPEAVAIHTEMVKKVNEFKSLPYAERTAEAFDALKQAIGDIRDKTMQGTTARRVVDAVYNPIKNEIVKQSPEYAQTMKNYQKASEQIKEMRKTLSLNENAMKDTKVRKLQSVMRNNVNTNYGARTKLAEELGKSQPDLMPALSGQAMNNWAPRGLANIGFGMGIVNAAASLNPIFLAMLPLTSPRLIGEAAYGMGRGVGMVKGAGNAVGAGSPLVSAMARYGYRGANVLRSLGLLDDDDEDISRKRR